jgi:heat shock protein HslJ
LLAHGRRSTFVPFTLARLLLLAACSRFSENGATDTEPVEETTTMAKTGSRHDSGELVGTEWTLKSLNGQDLVKGTRITLDFDKDFVRGNSGCNSYGGKVTMRNGVMKVKTPGFETTLIGCPGAVGPQENEYLDTLANGSEYRLEDDRPEIQNKAGETALIYEEKSGRKERR